MTALEPVLGSTAERDEFRAAVRAFLTARSPESAVRTLMDSAEGYDPQVWALMATQLGLQGMLIPAEYGGSGFGFTELAIVCEEMGRALLCAPFLSSAVLAPCALLASGDDAALRDYLPGIADGTTIATVVLGESIAEADGLTGSASFVLDGATASLLLVIVRSGSVYAVAGDAVGLTRTPLATLDQTRKLARLDFAQTPARLIGTDGGGARVEREVLDRGAIALAAEQTGGAARVLESAVEYAGSRIQFGVPIGSFQAIKHLCADVLVAVESARSAVTYAAWAVDHAPEDLPVAAPMAAACCAEAFATAAAANIQVHGGVGFTWEHSAHLYFKRAKSGEVLFGSPREHRRALANQLRLAPGAPTTVDR